jgi:hypothetical protein
MSSKPEDPAKPMSPRSVDGAVVIQDPPEAAMDLTADAAEISGIRLLDAADRARKRHDDPPRDDRSSHRKITSDGL